MEEAKELEAKLSHLEWASVTLVGGLIITLILISILNRPTPLPRLDSFSSMGITVEVSGAVEQPGKYHLSKSARLKDLLEQVILQECATLKGLNLNRRLQDGEVINLRAKEWIRVWVEGAVKHPRPYQVEKGTRVGELLTRLDLRDDAICHKLKKRHVLTEHETLTIPARKLAATAR